MRHISNESKIGCWLSLDAWSETYIGARWIAEKKLAINHYETTEVDGALSQMVLIAAHQLVEIMLFSCIQRNLEKTGRWNDVVEVRMRRMGFNEAFDKWPKRLLGNPFPKNAQAFSSARKLAARRNATVHKESAISTPTMARSALYTGVEASKAIQGVFEDGEFKYKNVLKKYPLQQEEWFCESMFPPEPGIK